LKIWDRNFLVGPTPAKDAYISSSFRLHRKYAETFGTDWRILSAWYGITHPDQLICDYNAKFRVGDLDPSRWWRLQGMFQQARALPRFDRAILLGGKIYRQIARKALQGVYLAAEIEEPFAGLDLLKTNCQIRQLLSEYLSQNHLLQTPKFIARNVNV
jgi:hypothetical protein